MPLSQENIEEYHKRALRQVERGASFGYVGSGNFIVIALKHEDEIMVVEVTNGYVYYSYKIKKKKNENKHYKKVV